jgi:hypothetical protein
MPDQPKVHECCGKPVEPGVFDHCWGCPNTLEMVAREAGRRAFERAKRDGDRFPGVAAAVAVKFALRRARGFSE